MAKTYAQSLINKYSSGHRLPHYYTVSAPYIHYVFICQKCDKIRYSVPAAEDHSINCHSNYDIVRKITEVTPFGVSYTW